MSFKARDDRSLAFVFRRTVYGYHIYRDNNSVPNRFSSFY